MRNLICWCPETQQPVNLQIYTDYVTLALIWSNPVRFECPHCGAKNEGGSGLPSNHSSSNLIKRNARSILEDCTISH
jgi:hypothetical protein